VQKIPGGYALVSKKEASRLIAQISTRAITASEARAILGFVEMHAIRKAAEAMRGKKKKGRELVPNFTPRELSRITGLSARSTSRAFNKAFSSKLMAPGKEHRIPVPRRVIRFLARCEKRSTILVLLTYIDRGLSLKCGRIQSAGTAKASLIAKRTGLSLRSVRLARAELLKLGIITPDTTKYQWKLNRDGAYFTVNVYWSGSRNITHVEAGKGSEPALKEAAVQKECVARTTRPATNIAPLPTRTSIQIAPPYRDKKTSKEELRDQKTQALDSNRSGVFSKQKGRPSITNVVMDDLVSFGRVENLYFQAVKRGLIAPTESNVLNFLAAAIRAREAAGEGPRIFMGIVRKGLWTHITQEQEDRARRAINHYREINPDSFRLKDPAPCRRGAKVTRSALKLPCYPRVFHASEATIHQSFFPQ
jgi:hypothetical protein